MTHCFGSKMAPRKWLGALGTAALLAASGCNSAPPAAPPSVANPFANARAHQALTVQQNPSYKEAAKLFDEGKIAEAKTKLAVLQTTPGLSATDKEFINQQIAICDSKLRPATQSPRHPVTLSPATRRLGDCGPRSLQIVFRKLGKDASLDSLSIQAGTTKTGTSLEGLAKAAEKQGCKAEGIQVNLAALKELKTPAVAWTNGNHYVAVLKVNGDKITIHDPNKTEEEVIAAEELLRRSGGILLTVSRK